MAVADVVQPRVEEITALMLLDSMMMQPSLKNYLFSIAHKRLMLIRISRVDMVAVVDAMVHARREWEHSQPSYLATPTDRLLCFHQPNQVQGLDLPT